MLEIQKNTIKNSEYLSLKQVCEELSISIATGYNWIKLKKLPASTLINKISYFKKEDIKKLKLQLQQNNSSLKSRRNKKFKNGNLVYKYYIDKSSPNYEKVSQLLSVIEKHQLNISKDIIYMLLTECAIQLITKKYNLPTQKKTNVLHHFLKKEIHIDNYTFLIKDFISGVSKPYSLIEKYQYLFNIEYEYIENEDLLGLLYLSLNNINNRKATGAYYTPVNIVKKLVSNVFKRNNYQNKTIFDPCCGSGNFLLQLPKDIPFNYIYANDIDFIGVRLTRINLALKYNIYDYKILKEHVTDFDYLTHQYNNKFDFIIGNPPWGYEFNNSEKIILKEKYLVAQATNIESYDVVTEKALQDLNIGGILSFVIPEAILNVKGHIIIRKVIISKSNLQYLEYLGNVFSGVQCPSIILQLKYTNKRLNTTNTTISINDNIFSICSDRDICEQSLLILTNDEEDKIIQKIQNIPNKITLKNNAQFALGIVTGDNKHKLSSEKIPNSERIIKGSDISKYKIAPCENYIIYKEANLQQSAPLKIYREKEKLLYRFISNSLIFAYDNQKSLTLNSCNILIPQISGLNIKYILAVLNSQIAQFYYSKNFKSVKVLRSYIEQIPIPKADNTTQKQITELVDKILKSQNQDKTNTLYEMIDNQIKDLYNLSQKEYDIIKKR